MQNEKDLMFNTASGEKEDRRWSRGPESGRCKSRARVTDVGKPLVSARATSKKTITIQNSKGGTLILADSPTTRKIMKLTQRELRKKLRRDYAWNKESVVQILPLGQRAIGATIQFGQ